MNDNALRFVESRATDSRGTDSTLRVSRTSTVIGRPLAIGPSKYSRLPEVDQVLAAIHTADRARLLSLPAADIVREAKRLNAKLLDSLESMGPLETNEIAKTLLCMFDKMESYLDQAKIRQKRTVPIIKGVEWGEANPLAGTVVGIPPFHMIDWWATFKTDTTAEVERRLSVTKKEKRPDPPKKEMPFKKNIPSYHDFLRIANRAVKLVPSKRLEKLTEERKREYIKRINCLLNKMLLTTTDDQYIPPHIYNLYDTGTKMPSPDRYRLPHFREDIDSCRKNIYKWNIDIPDEVISRRILALEDHAFWAYRMTRMEAARSSKSLQKGLYALLEWFEQKASSPRSIFSCYKRWF